MPRKLRELRRDLQAAGFYIARQEGSHQVWRHPKLSGVQAVIAGKDSRDAQPYNEREIRKALAALKKHEEQEKGRE